MYKYGGDGGIIRLILRLTLRAPFGREKSLPAIFSNKVSNQVLTTHNIHCYEPEKQAHINKYGGDGGIRTLDAVPHIHP